MNTLTYKIAMKFLRSKRKEGFISVVSIFSLIGIALGVATLIIVMSVMNGYHKEFLKNILGIQGHVTVVSTNKSFTNYQDVSNQIEKIPDVAFTAPIIIEQAMFVSKKTAQGGVVRGIEPEKLMMKPMIKDVLHDSVKQALESGGNIIIGEYLARNLGVGVGDEVKIVIPSSTTTVLGSIPKSKTFRVAATFDVGLYQYNSTTVFMNLQDAQTLFRYGNTVGEIEVIAQNPQHLNNIKDTIGSMYGDQFELVDWEMAQSKWLNALAVERSVMFFILTLIILVAVFNIISSLIMLVKDKSKAIAILRTMGMTKAQVIQIFLYAGSLIGVIGSISGAILGTAFALNIEKIKSFLEQIAGVQLFDPVVYFLSNLPSDVYFSDVIGILLMSLFFSFLATLYPAYRAAKMMPIEVIRYE